MARFYRIQLGSLHLTSNGAEGGTPCKLQVIGADQLTQSFRGTTIVSISGAPKNQLFSTGAKGRPIEIRIEVIPKAVWTQVISLIDTALAEETTILIVGTGDTGNFSKACLPMMPAPYSAESFINGLIKGVSLRFITA